MKNVKARDSERQSMHLGQVSWNEYRAVCEL